MVRSVFGIALGLGLALGATLATHAWAQSSPPPAGGATTPYATASKAPKGTLKNPYAAQEAAHDEKLADEGHNIFSGYGCPGCHGGGGGGGMCPPITNGVWIYGDADDTLFRLVALGSIDLQKQGYSRQAIENVVAPMPSFGNIIKTNDDLWKIITWVKIQAYKNTHSQQ